MQYGKVKISNPLKVGIPTGVTALVGDNGSGKTTFANILDKGRHAYGNNLSFLKPGMRIKMLTFSDIHSLSGREVQYFAQRMEATMNDLVPSVAEAIGKKCDSPRWKELCRQFHLEEAEQKKVNYLSSGELRKLLTISALVDRPDLLILDNPYIGLDAFSRIEFDKTISQLPRDGTSVMMLIADPNEIPDYTDFLITIEDCELTGLVSGKEEVLRRKRELSDRSNVRHLTLPERGDAHRLPHNISFSISNGHCRYGDKEIFSGVDWTVRKGEQWVLQGPNGSGKSLLLSMICADNPQGYSNDITLFDRKRGSGESIWEIKDSIGYVSPEQQRFFKSNSTVQEILIQGRRNALNKFRPSTIEERTLASQWLELLRISHLGQRQFSELSDGEQRLVLLGAAFIKRPELLVLDEPLHGLDRKNKENVLDIINKLSSSDGTTLIYVTHDASEIRTKPKIKQLKEYEF